MCWVNKLETAGGVGAFGEGDGVGGEEDFDGGVGVEFPDVAADCGAVAAAEDDVHVDDGLAVECGNVADEGEDLDLLIGDGGVVEPGFEIDPAGGGGTDGSDAGEVGVSDLVFDGEIGEAAEDFVAFEEDDGVDLFLWGVFDEFGLHVGGFAGGDGAGGVDGVGELGKTGDREQEDGEEGQRDFHTGILRGRESCCRSRFRRMASMDEGQDGERDRETVPATPRLAILSAQMGNERSKNGAS